MKRMSAWMGSRRILVALVAGLLGLVGVVVGPQPARAATDVYSNPGIHYVNGRQWWTTCEPYSATQRCTTKIWATQVTQSGGRFVTKTGWFFNNLTYLSSPRSLWARNPLAAYGVPGGTANWTTGGRQWRTECDTAVTGRGGCRSYIRASVIESYRSGGRTNYRWVVKWVFNNMIRFGPLGVQRDVMMNHTVHLTHFDVTVSDPVWDGDGTAFGALVKVCYARVHPDAGSDGKVRVSWDTWSFGVLDLEAGATELAYFPATAVPASTLWTPAYTETRLALGACNTGYIAIHHGNPDLSSAFTMRYTPGGSADRVTWFTPA